MNFKGCYFGYANAGGLKGNISLNFPTLSILYMW